MVILYLYFVVISIARAINYLSRWLCTTFLARNNFSTFNAFQLSLDCIFEIAEEK